MDELALMNQTFVRDSISTILFGFALSLIALIILSFIFKRFSISLSGKSHIGSVLVLIGLTVFLMITVIKSSLALSLGLVGALSIVRFRTPIKEPEELAYLFISIGIGLGYAANYYVITSLLLFCIMLYIVIRSYKYNQSYYGEYSLVVTSNKQIKPKEISDSIDQFISGSKVVRIENDSEQNMLVIRLSLNSKKGPDDIVQHLRTYHKDLSYSMLEAGVNW